MTITAEAGPQVTYGFTQTSSGVVTEYNEQRGPTLNDLGQGILDPRPPYCYQPGGAQIVRSFWNGYAAVDAIPGTVSTVALAASQVPVSSATYTVLLTSTSTVNTIITTKVSLTPPEGGALVTGLLGIDMSTATSSNVGLQQIVFGQAQSVTYNSAGNVSVWDPRAASARAVSWFGSSNSTSEYLSVAGRDLYGYKMTENIYCTIGASGPNKGQKAWKYISAISLNSSTGTIGSTALLVGIQDVYGFPMRVDQSPYATIWFGQSSNNTLVTLSTGNHTFALSSVVQVSTSIDVRGTYASTGGSNSSATAPIRLTMFVTPSVQNLPTTTFTDASGLFGNAQFSSV